MPSTSPAPAWARLQRLALIALCLQALFAINDLSMRVHPEYGVLFGLVAMTLAGRQPWRELGAHPAVRLLGVFALFLLLHSAYAMQLMPGSEYASQLTVAAKLLRLGVGTCVIGWWLSVQPRAIPYVLMCLVVGVLVTALYHMPWASLPGVLAGEVRPWLGVSQNLSGLFAAVGAWLALCLLIGIWRDASHSSRRAVLLPAGILVYVGCFYVLLVSQSRGAWLSFGVAVPLAILGYWITRGRRRNSLPWGPIVLAFTVSVLLLLVSHRIFTLRFDGAAQLLPTWAEAMVDPAGTAGGDASAPGSTPASTGEPRAHAGPAMQNGQPLPDIEGVDTTIPGNKAVGIRVVLYELGVQKFLERPWLGWGLDSIPQLIEQARLPVGGERYVHLHNAYLDALVGIGLIGSALLLSIFAMLMRELFLAWRHGVVSTASFWGLAGCMGIVLIANSFDSLLWRFEYARAPLELLFGCCMAYGLIRKRKQREEAAN